MFQIEETAYYADTDAYGVVWHGAYLRWLEKARSLYCRNRGVSLEELEKNNFIFPVIELNIKYKNPVKLHDKISITTSFHQLSPLKFAFEQSILNSKQQICVKATVVVAVVSHEGKIYRSTPEIIERLIG